MKNAVNFVEVQSNQRNAFRPCTKLKYIFLSVYLLHWQNLKSLGWTLIKTDNKEYVWEYEATQTKHLQSHTKLNTELVLVLIHWFRKI